MEYERVAAEYEEKETRTDSVQKVCGGVWQGFDHLIKLGSSKVEVVCKEGKEALQLFNQ